ncbi:prepilin peptidase [Deinococcus fonticola]|uniref:prepilin peptidase n=1 Tax=Deinococcus fonticola TaxID=2528713 RepID=UPI00107578A1|nr:A24 family peptidase [Deinococcus fonticola]
MNVDTLMIIFAGIFGLLVGSFSNVLIWRLPRHENIAFPPSHCPKCDHQLRAIDLVPVFSWVSLGGKCRYCRAPINPRYPMVETITGLAYAAIAALYPVTTYGVAPLGLMFLFTILLAGSLIDLEVFELPDELTLVGVALGLIFAFLHGGVGNLPDLPQALNGALMGAGIIVLISLLGSWVMRRFRERQYPEFPVGYQQISLGLLVGAWFGPLAALIAAAASMLLNMGARKVVRVPEIITLGGFFVSLVLSSSGLGPNLINLLQGGLAGAGAASLLCGVYWWIVNARNKQADAEAEDAPSDPVAMGFGDVKLMAAIGAFLGWQAVLVALVVSVFAGAVIGLVMMAMKKGNKIPFGPYLAIGAVVALFWGEPIIRWYSGLMGL